MTIASSSLEAGVSYWANPSGGDWNVAANWMPAVVPGADAEARITIQGAEDYTVRFAGTEPKPAKIVVGTDIAAKARLSIAGEAAFTPHTWIEVNRGGEIVVPSGGRFVYDQATNTVGNAQMIKIANGRFVVDGGYAMVTNACGYTWVSGADGELLVENGGELVLADRANGSGNGCLRLVQGGALRMTGGTIDIPSRFYASYLNQDIDGVCDFSGGTLKLRRETETARIWFSGDATFSDSVVWTNSSANVAISPRANGGAMTFSMKDNATMTGSEPYVYIGGMGDTTVQMDSTGRIQARQGNVGVAKGHALYRQTAGLASFGTCGLSAGMTKQRDPSAGSDAADNAVTGTVEVAGGALVVDGSAAGNTSWNGGASNMFPPGTVLGYGGTAHPPASGRPYVGRMAISGTGALTNRYGHILVGVAPHGEGSLVLDGGTLRSTCEKVAGQGDFRELIACAVGVGGGKGEFLVRGGECAISNNVWIGGVSTNALRVPVGVSGVTLLAYPYETHGGEGLLEVSGGSVAFGRDLVVGAEGTGVVSVVGSRISAFTVGRDLVLTNEAAIVVGGAETATLRFKADANGVTPIEVAGKLVVTPQAKLEIDLSDFDIQHTDSLTLATYASKEGAFGADRITLTGCVPEATVVRVKETRIEVARCRPTVLVVR